MTLKLSNEKAHELGIPGHWTLVLHSGETGKDWTRRDFYAFEIDGLQGYREALERKTAGAVGLITPSGAMLKSEAVRQRGFIDAVATFFAP